MTRPTEPQAQATKATSCTEAAFAVLDHLCEDHRALDQRRADRYGLTVGDEEHVTQLHRRPGLERERGDIEDAALVDSILLAASANYSVDYGPPSKGAQTMYRCDLFSVKRQASASKSIATGSAVSRQLARSLA